MKLIERNVEMVSKHDTLHNAAGELVDNPDTKVDLFKQ